MTWASDFDAQWRTLMNVVQTRVQRECAANGRCDAALVEAIVAAERSKWDDSSHHNGAWLRKLVREHRQVGESFERALGEVRACAPPPATGDGGRGARGARIARIARIAPLLLAAALAAVACAGLRVLGYAWWQQALAAASVAVLAASALGGWLAARRRKRTAAWVRELREGLEREGSRLRALLAQAEGGGVDRPVGDAALAIPRQVSAGGARADGCAAGML